MIMRQHSAVTDQQLNPFMKNGFAHHYHLGESTVILGASGVILNFFYFFFFMKFLEANRVAPDGMPCTVVSVVLHLGLYCLPLSLKKDARPILIFFKPYQKP